MPVKIIIEDPNKYRRMNQIFPNQEWQKIVSDFGSAVTITEDGARLLENGTMRLLENGQTRNLE